MRIPKLGRTTMISALLLALTLLGINYEQDRVIQNQRAVLRLLLSDSTALAQCQGPKSQTLVTPAADKPVHVLVKTSAPAPVRQSAPAIPAPLHPGL